MSNIQQKQWITETDLQNKSQILESQDPGYNITTLMMLKGIKSFKICAENRKL